jgi:hypothetical protein
MAQQALSTQAAARASSWPGPATSRDREPAGFLRASAGHMREYVTVVKQLLDTGKTSFQEPSTA